MRTLLKALITDRQAADSNRSRLVEWLFAMLAPLRTLLVCVRVIRLAPLPIATVGHCAVSPAETLNGQIRKQLNHRGLRPRVEAEIRLAIFRLARFLKHPQII